MKDHIPQNNVTYEHSADDFVGSTVNKEGLSIFIEGVNPSNDKLLSSHWWKVLDVVNLLPSNWLVSLRLIILRAKYQFLLNVSLCCWNVSPSAAVVDGAVLENGVLFFQTNVQPLSPSP